MLPLNQILNGDALKLLKTLPDNSVDSVVMDPPYGIGFMGKEWDTFKNDILKFQQWFYDIAVELLRVLKPGGHLLSFCGCRTYHRMACAIEDAGFEIRDQMQWLFGSGFPKSLNVSKAIDQLHGATRSTEAKMVGDINNGHYAGKSESPRVLKEVAINKPVTDDAKKWNGYGTALKPANEPICVARKPLEKGLTVAQNVLKWGTGGINIDGCLVQNDNGEQMRWPANLLMDEFVAYALDRQTGNLTSGAMQKDYEYTSNGFSMNKPTGSTRYRTEANEGGASRFFYCAKASKSERNHGCDALKKEIGGVRNESGLHITRRDGNDPKPVANFHPTVKPVKLMQYLVRLVTPGGGVCIDPFCGSGTTGIACKLEEVNYILIDQEKDYCAIAAARIAAWNPEEEEMQLSLFEPKQMKA